MSGGASNPREAKKAARAEARRRLAGVDAGRAREWSARVCERLGALVRERGFRRVFLYLAAGVEEPDLSGLAQSLRVGGAGMGEPVIAAPRVDWDAGTMRAVPLGFDGGGAARTEVRRHGVPEPPIGPEAVGPAFSEGFSAGSFDLVLVPGLAFDRSMARLGRGAGFYDRWLAGIDFTLGVPGRPLVVGVCFDVQVVEALPCEPHDVRMDGVATDCRLMWG